MATIRTDKGQIVEATEPIIISASRSTDIPAFYAKWFMNRLKKGYCIWYNPFNQKPTYVSFARTKVVVFWTKNPAPMIPYLSELDKRGIHYYFQVTLNDYENEHLEPNLPSLEKRINTFKQLSDLIGKERVIWRFDPLIITKELTPQVLLKRIGRIGEEIKDYTRKLVFSFVDVGTYRKVQNNLVKDTNLFTKDSVQSAEMNESQIKEFSEGLAKLREEWRIGGCDITLATCGEPIDLDKYGIEHNRCIDGELMKRIFATDDELVYYLNTGKLQDKNDLFAASLPIKSLTPKELKDKGQRKECGCVKSKDIGMYNTCRHFCAYCYANTSRKCVLDNMCRHNEDSESVIE